MWFSTPFSICTLPYLLHYFALPPAHQQVFEHSCVFPFLSLIFFFLCSCKRYLNTPSAPRAHLGIEPLKCSLDVNSRSSLRLPAAFCFSQASFALYPPFTNLTLPFALMVLFGCERSALAVYLSILLFRPLPLWYPYRSSVQTSLSNIRTFIPRQSLFSALSSTFSVRS